MIDTCTNEFEPVPIPVPVPPGHWRRDDTHLPLPVTPKTGSVTTTKAASAEFGLLVEPRFSTTGGWSSLCVAPVGARPNRPSPPGRPSWSVLFPSAGAVVTDAGGGLPRPAITVRAHRIPAEVLRDGQIVTVDGSRGVVEVEA